MKAAKLAQASLDGRRKYLEVKEVAQVCGISETTVRQEIRRGNLRAKKFGRNVRIHVDELSRYEESSDYLPHPYW